MAHICIDNDIGIIIIITIRMLIDLYVCVVYIVMRGGKPMRCGGSGAVNVVLNMQECGVSLGF